jgi:hypothetical protein
MECGFWQSRPASGPRGLGRFSEVLGGPGSRKTPGGGDYRTRAQRGPALRTAPALELRGSLRIWPQQITYPFPPGFGGLPQSVCFASSAAWPALLPLGRRQNGESPRWSALRMGRKAGAAPWRRGSAAHPDGSPAGAHPAASPAEASKPDTWKLCPANSKGQTQGNPSRPAAPGRVEAWVALLSPPGGAGGPSAAPRWSGGPLGRPGAVEGSPAALPDQVQ